MNRMSHRAFVDNLHNQITGATDFQRLPNGEKGTSDSTVWSNDVLKGLIKKYDKLFGDLAEATKDGV